MEERQSVSCVGDENESCGMAVADAPSRGACRLPVDIKTGSPSALRLFSESVNSVDGLLCGGDDGVSTGTAGVAEADEAAGTEEAAASDIAFSSCSLLLRFVGSVGVTSRAVLTVSAGGGGCNGDVMVSRSHTHTAASKAEGGSTTTMTGLDNCGGASVCGASGAGVGEAGSDPDTRRAVAAKIGEVLLVLFASWS